MENGETVNEGLEWKWSSDLTLIRLVLVYCVALYIVAIAEHVRSY